MKKRTLRSCVDHTQFSFRNVKFAYNFSFKFFSYQLSLCVPFILLDYTGSSFIPFLFSREKKWLCYLQRNFDLYHAHVKTPMWHQLLVVRSSDNVIFVFIREKSKINRMLSQNMLDDIVMKRLFILLYFINIQLVWFTIC
jgi:hypothetical protein